MPSPFFLILHSALMALTGIVLAAAVLSVALLTRQGQKLHTLLLLVVLPATTFALLLPFLLTGTGTRPVLITLLQGVLIGPVISLAPLTRLKNTPGSWAATAQELGAGRKARFTLLWLPLLGNALAVGLFLALIISLLGTFALIKASLP
ncbi:hypothetical protein [Acetobacter cibinongensis]|nr:hypothetical protein [Acetobacter cibinongensis]